MLAADVADALKRGCKGIVLAGVGDGDSSKAVIDALTAAAKQGALVARSSRVGSGFTVRNAEVNDDQLGFIAAGDLNRCKSRVLPRLLIASGVSDKAKVQQEFMVR